MALEGHPRMSRHEALAARRRADLAVDLAVHCAEVTEDGWWVELAERAAFKGHYRRAINRYKDALFYLERESVKEEVRSTGAERIGREIEVLKSRLKASNRRAEENPPGAD